MTYVGSFKLIIQSGRMSEEKKFQGSALLSEKVKNDDSVTVPATATYSMLEFHCVVNRLL